MEEAAELDNDPSYRQFKSEKSRKKYRKFVRIIEIRSQIKNHQNDANEEQSVVMYECLTCGKTSSTGNILRHLKTHGIEKTDIDNQCDEDGDDPIPKERFDRPNTLFVASNVTPKIPLEKPPMDKLCRLCARRSKTLHPIFRMYNGHLLNDQISNLCPIQIEPGDSLPKQICDECLEIVVSANALRETSLQSDINFRSGNSPEEQIQVKEEPHEDELQIDDEEQMIEYPMSSSPQRKRKQAATRNLVANTKTLKQPRRLDFPLKAASSTSGKAFECDHCKETFTRRTSIEQHMRAVHFKDLKITQPQRHSCPLNCGVTFSLVRSVKCHIKNIHKAEVHKFRCNFGCNKIFLSEKTLFSHERMKSCTPAPSTPELPVCHICGKIMPSAAAMNRHIRTHENTKTHQCTQCPAKFFTKAHLERHRSVHTKDRPFSCEKCVSTFKDERSLRKHGLSIHDKVRRHTCEFCGKKFFALFKLTQHLRTHTGEKPFMCKFCDMSYAQNGDLLRHLGRAHVGDSIYGCTIEGCTESFRLKSELADHYKVHYPNKATG